MYGECVNQAVAKLGKFLMIRYSLANDYFLANKYFLQFDMPAKEVELVREALNEIQQVYSEEESLGVLEMELDSYIRENDWTGYFGVLGSGNRERGFMIEGCIEYAIKYV